MGSESLTLEQEYGIPNPGDSIYIGNSTYTFVGIDAYTGDWILSDGTNTFEESPNSPYIPPSITTSTASDATSGSSDSGGAAAPSSSGGILSGLMTLGSIAMTLASKTGQHILTSVVTTIMSNPIAAGAAAVGGGYILYSGLSGMFKNGFSIGGLTETLAGAWFCYMGTASLLMMLGVAAGPAGWIALAVVAAIMVIAAIFGLRARHAHTPADKAMMELAQQVAPSSAPANADATTPAVSPASYGGYSSRALASVASLGVGLATVGALGLNAPNANLVYNTFPVHPITLPPIHPIPVPIGSNPGQTSGGGGGRDNPRIVSPADTMGENAGLTALDRMVTGRYAPHLAYTNLFVAEPDGKGGTILRPNIDAVAGFRRETALLEQSQQDRGGPRASAEAVQRAGYADKMGQQ
jgi:hypothetical protein